MMRKFYLVLLSAAFAFGALDAAPVVVTKQVAENPKLCFSGISGNAEFSAAVESMLKASGWFDVTSDRDALYSLTGSVSGGRAETELAMGGVGISKFAINVGQNSRESAKKLVDAILERTFKDLKIKGFCTTRIAFCADTAKNVKNIYVCDIDGKNVRQVTFFKTLCVEPAWLNGGSIAYTKYNKSTSDIIETRLDPLQSRRLTSLDGLNVGVAFDENHRRIAMISSGSRDHRVDLYVRGLAAGSPMKRLTSNKAVEASPCFSPDGREICFVSDASGRPRLYVIPAGGGTAKRLPSIGSEAVTPDWSSDGEKIIYSTRVNGAYALALYNVKTGENKQITRDSGVWESPCWAPDNRHVVCKRSDGGKSRLMVVDTRTGKYRMLIYTGNNLSMPSWSKARSEK